MSNPWKESAADIAVTPLTYLYASFHDAELDVKIPDTSSKDSLVNRLRLADEVTQRRRELKYKNKVESMYSETTLTNGLIEELDSIFRKLSQDFDLFLCGDLLKNGYDNSIYVNIKDNLNDENRAKIVDLIRASVKVIRKLKETKSGSSLQIREENFTSLLRSSGIMDESKRPHDYAIDDLFDLITECNMQIRTLKDFNAFPASAAGVIAKLDC